LHYENGLTVANGDYVLLHGGQRLGRPANWIVVVSCARERPTCEHWDVIQTSHAEQSQSGLPMFGDKFRGNLAARLNGEPGQLPA